MQRTPGNDTDRDSRQPDPIPAEQPDGSGNPNRNLEEAERELRQVPGHELGREGDPQHAPDADPTPPL